MAKKGLGRGFSSLIPTEMIIDEKIDIEKIVQTHIMIQN